MIDQKPGLFGLANSNRDFAQKDTWGKNQFNSSFPAALSAYLSSKGLDNVYLYLNSQLKVEQGYVTTAELYGISPFAEDLFYAFEALICRTYNC